MLKITILEVEEQKGVLKVESAGDNVANDLLRQQEYAQELAAIAELNPMEN